MKMDYNGTEYVPSTPKAIDVYFKWPLRYTTLSYGVQIFEFFELNVTYFLRHFVTYLTWLYFQTVLMSLKEHAVIQLVSHADDA